MGVDIPLDISPSVLKKIEAFYKDCQLRNYDKRQLLVMSGEEVQHIYYLKSGEVRLYDITKNGNEVVVGIYKAPTLFPLGRAFLKDRSPFFYEAATKVSVKAAPADDVLEFISQTPDVVFSLLVEIYEAADMLRRRVAFLAGGKAKDRILFGLLAEGFPTWQNKPLKDSNFLIKISEGELGARVGVSRETASRELNKLKNSGLLKISPKGITVKSMNAVKKRLSISF